MDTYDEDTTINTWTWTRGGLLPLHHGDNKKSMTVIFVALPLQYPHVAI